MGMRVKQTINRAKAARLSAPKIRIRSQRLTVGHVKSAYDRQNKANYASHLVRGKQEFDDGSNGGIPKDGMDYRMRMHSTSRNSGCRNLTVNRITPIPWLD